MYNRHGSRHLRGLGNCDSGNPIEDSLCQNQQQSQQQNSTDSVYDQVTSPLLDWLENWWTGDLTQHQNDEIDKLNAQGVVKASQGAISYEEALAQAKRDTDALNRLNKKDTMSPLAWAAVVVGGAAVLITAVKG